MSSEASRWRFGLYACPAARYEKFSPPAPSPDGRWIVYTHSTRPAFVPSKHWLYLIHPDGTGGSLLTRGPADPKPTPGYVSTGSLNSLAVWQPH